MSLAENIEDVCAPLKPGLDPRLMSDIAKNPVLDNGKIIEMLGVLSTPPGKKHKVLDLATELGLEGHNRLHALVLRVMIATQDEAPENFHFRLDYEVYSERTLELSRKDGFDSIDTVMDSLAAENGLRRQLVCAAYLFLAKHANRPFTVSEIAEGIPTDTSTKTLRKTMSILDGLCEERGAHLPFKLIKTDTKPRTYMLTPDNESWSEELAIDLLPILVTQQPNIPAIYKYLLDKDGVFNFDDLPEGTQLPVDTVEDTLPRLGELLTSYPELFSRRLHRSSNDYAYVSLRFIDKPDGYDISRPTIHIYAPTDKVVEITSGMRNAALNSIGQTDHRLLTNEKPSNWDSLLANGTWIIPGDSVHRGIVDILTPYAERGQAVLTRELNAEIAEVCDITTRKASTTVGNLSTKLSRFALAAGLTVERLGDYAYMFFMDPTLRTRIIRDTLGCNNMREVYRRCFYLDPVINFSRMYFNYRMANDAMHLELDPDERDLLFAAERGYACGKPLTTAALTRECGFSSTYKADAATQSLFDKRLVTGTYARKITTGGYEPVLLNIPAARKIADREML